MLDNLLALAKEVGGDYMRTDNGIDNAHADDALNLAGGSIVDTLKSQVTGGNASDIMSMLSGSAGSGGGVMQSIIQNFAGSMGSKFGLDSGTASTIASKVIPMIMDKFVSKTNDPNDNSFDIQSVASSLIGGGGAGGLDIGGLMNMVSGNKEGGTTTSGGLADIAKGFFN